MSPCQISCGPAAFKYLLNRSVSRYDRMLSEKFHREKGDLCHCCYGCRVFHQIVYKVVIYRIIIILIIKNPYCGVFEINLIFDREYLIPEAAVHFQGKVNDPSGWCTHWKVHSPYAIVCLISLTVLTILNFVYCSLPDL